MNLKYISILIPLNAVLKQQNYNNFISEYSRTFIQYYGLYLDTPKSQN